MVGSRRQRLMVDKAILSLKVQRDKLRQYARSIQLVLDRERELAKEAVVQGQKQKALLILRRRKYQEQLLVKTDQQLETLEQLVRLGGRE
jgi:charged multivesicular body protein 6